MDFQFRPLFFPHDPRMMMVLSSVTGLDPREELKKLREVDPDGYANLTEHIMFEDDDA